MTRAPIERVIAQIRFPMEPALQKSESMVPFRDALRRDYPVLRQDKTSGVVIGPGGGIGVGPSDEVLWRFSDRTDGWRVSLSPEFVALETKRYDSRTRFFSRLEQVLETLAAICPIPLYDRIGIRYINRIRNPELERLSELIHPDVLGLGASNFSPARLEHSVCHTILAVDDTTKLNVRHGRLGPGASTDPFAIEPLDQPSWLLDMDMFSLGQRELIVKELVDECRRFAETIYGVFRWCTTDKFLTTYGAHS